MRELRQHASRYLARVAAGERLEVTDRGRPVALLVPVSVDPWDQLLESGRVRRPGGREGLTAEEAGEYGISATEELAHLRADDG